MPEHRGVIFVVDDEDSFRLSASELLEDEGYLVLPARDGCEALARMRGFAGRGVAVIDLVMPAMDGASLIRAMRSDPHLRSIPIVVVTAKPIMEFDGAASVLRKPFDAPTLVSTIARLCPTA